MDDDYLGAGLENLQLGALRGTANQSLNQTSQALLLRLGLLEKRLACPPLIAGL